jgi:putative phosphoribosyl transferase
MMLKLPFRDRVEAGRLLGAKLAARKFPANTIVLALTRGGVPVGVEVAESLNCSLDVVVARKLGVPWQPELAMGAISGEARVLDRQLIREVGVSENEIEEEIAKETQEMRRREKLYRNDLPAADLRGLNVIIVDDGLATGSTMLAAVRHVRTAHPTKIIVAIPVGSLEGCERILTEADECLCLVKPRYFSSVGEWYQHFPQLTDAEVSSLLKQTRNAGAAVR